MPSTSVLQSAAISGGASTAAYLSASCCRAGASWVGSVRACAMVALTDCSRETAWLQKAAASALLGVPPAEEELLLAVAEALLAPAEGPGSEPPHAESSRAATDRPAA